MKVMHDLLNLLLTGSWAFVTDRYMCYRRDPDSSYLRLYHPLNGFNWLAPRGPEEDGAWLCDYYSSSYFCLHGNLLPCRIPTIMFYSS